MLFSFIYNFIEDTWLNDISISTSAGTGNSDKDICNVCTTNVAIENTTETSIGKGDAVRTVENTNAYRYSTNEKNVSMDVSIDMNNVSTNRDTTVTNYHVMEKNKNCFPVQKVHGEMEENTDNYIIDSTSDLESDYKEDKNSVAYIASHVEKIDLLNFNDSDVSI